MVERLTSGSPGRLYTAADLTDFERELAVSVEFGDPVSGRLPGGCKKVARASVLLQILVGMGDFGSVGFDLMDLRDASVSGQLDLRGRATRGPVRFTRCTFPDRILLDDARVQSFSLTGCVLSAGLSAVAAEFTGGLRIVADEESHQSAVVQPEQLPVAGGVSERLALALEGVRIAGSLWVAGADVTGPTVLRAASVGGDLDLQDSVFNGGVDGRDIEVHGDLLLQGVTCAAPPRYGGCALSLEAASIRGSIVGGSTPRRERGALTAKGPVWMARAEIGGRVNLQQASITADHGLPSLTLDLARIEGGLVCAKLTSIGELRLLGATIRGQVDFSDGRFENPRGVAIAMDGSSISGGLFLQFAYLSGTVRLVGADVDGLVSLTGTDFENPGERSTTEHAGFSPDVAIRARMTPSYKRFLSEVETPARVDFAPAAAVDELGLALSMEQARIRGPLFLDCDSVQGLMNLSHCSVDVLVQYDPLTAPPTIIDGLAFPRIHPGPGPDAPFVKVGDRLAWLAQEPTGYRPGAYAALASAYDRAGHEGAARQVRIASQNARYADAPSPRRAWGWLQRWTVGYGYRPARAIVWLLGYWVLGSALLWWADRRDESLFTVTGGRPWTPASYFLDLLLPFVDLPQTKEVTASGWGQWLVVGLVAFGFVLFTAALAGISGAVARRT